MNEIYDVVMIGGGPAGLTAGIYVSRSRMKAVLLEKVACGGQILTADLIENFPGFPCGTTGSDLADMMLKQAEACGLEISTREVKKISPAKNEKGRFAIETAEGDNFEALSVIIAAGARWNALGVPGEDELKGRGVSYCATCDGPLFKEKDVVVVGGGDTALEDALFLTKFANKVIVVHRRDRLRATKVLQERAFANKKIEFCLNSVVTRIVGKNKVESVGIRSLSKSSEFSIKTDGVFVLIGITPNSEIVKGLVELDEHGHIVCDQEMRTSLDGIFACGDVVKKILRQIVTAVGEGATAAVSARRYVEKLKGIEYK